MNNVLNIVENSQTSEFYPTPESLVEKMLQGIDWNMIESILEPSAGKGDILRVLGVKENILFRPFDVDCIEIDANLRQILKYNFSEEREKEISQKIKDIEDSRKWDMETRKYSELTAAQEMELQSLKAEKQTFLKNGIHIVYDDFLNYEPFKKYDLIIMNPPFSNGDKHLLKALKIQEKGGSIVCLLNSETLKNPYTDSRRELLKQLNKYGATIEYIQNAFVSAERKTGVEIALVKVHIEQTQEESDIYNRLKESEHLEDIPEDVTDIEVTDYIKMITNQFNVEVKAGLELIRQYRALQPYMLDSFSKGDKYIRSILTLTDDNGRNYKDVSINGYVQKTRLKYWEALFSNPKFTGKLTSKLQEEYRSKVNSFKDYDFSEFNISTIAAEMNSRVKTGIEDEIIKMFDRLTEEHSYYPECQKNRHYYDGWETNKAHKIGKKVIIPCYGVFNSWNGKLCTYEARSVLEDIEKVLNYLDGNITREINLWNQLETNFKNGETKNIELKFFKATFYKKGTVHLVFTCPELIERFNIYAAQNKAWLPPCYGKKKYQDMVDEEKAVVDSFQGEKAYNDVMARANYYLAPVTGNKILILSNNH